MKKFVSYFDEISTLSKKLILTYQDLSFDKEKELVETMVLTYLRLLKINAKTLSILIANELYIPSILICRNVLEAFFNLHWAMVPEAKDENNDNTNIVKLTESENEERERIERIEKVNQLEGDMYSHFERDIKEMERGLEEGQITWRKEVIEDMRKRMSAEILEFPNLVTRDRKDNLVFKKSPNMAIKMGEHKNKFYHVYTFTSAFVHPTPKLKEFLPCTPLVEERTMKIISEPLYKTYSSTIFFIQSTMGYSKAMFDKLSPHLISERELIMQRINDILCEADPSFIIEPDKN
jgi:hypothetical protein